MLFQHVALLICFLLITCSFSNAKYELRNNTLFDHENKQVPEYEYANVLRYMCETIDQTKYNETIAEWLIDNGLVVNVRFNAPIRCAAKAGHTLLVAKLLKNEVVNPGSDNDLAIRLASYYGYSEIVQLLLNESKVNPGAYNHESIQLASERGHTKVVQLLLNDRRVEPSANDNYAIRWASKNGHSEIVKLLLNDRRVDPSANNNEAIRWASEYGHLEVLKLLLNDKRGNPAANFNEAIRFASQNGYVEVLKFLLKDETVECTMGNLAIQYASLYGQAATVEVLLSNSNVDARQAFGVAIFKEYYGIIEIINKARPKLFLDENEYALNLANEKIQVNTKLSVVNNNLIIYYESLKDYKATFVLYSKNDSTVYLTVENISKGKLSIEMTKLSGSYEWNWRWICAKQAIENTGKFDMDSIKSIIPHSNNSTVTDTVNRSTEESMFPISIIALIVISASGLSAIVFVLLFIRFRGSGKNSNI